MAKSLAQFELELELLSESHSVLEEENAHLKEELEVLKKENSQLREHLRQAYVGMEALNDVLRFKT